MTNKYYIQYNNKILDYREANSADEALKEFISDLDIDTNILTEDEFEKEYPEEYQKSREWMN